MPRRTAAAARLPTAAPRTRCSGPLNPSINHSSCQSCQCLQDCYGSPLTFSGASHDTLLVSQVSAAFNSARDSSALFASLEQSLPVRQEWLNFSRLRLRAERPLQLGPATLSLKGRAGGVFGDLPPYEAFPIGGTNSVRCASACFPARERVARIMHSVLACALPCVVPAELEAACWASRTVQSLPASDTFS